MSVIHIFLKNSYFFKIEKFQFLRKMEDFCHFDALNFLKVKSGEKNKNVSKRLGCGATNEPILEKKVSLTLDSERFRR